MVRLGVLPLSESDLSEDMVDPWLSFLILSVPLCSCSSRTRSSLCSQRRRPFSCSARSSCSCSFWGVRTQTNEHAFRPRGTRCDNAELSPSGPVSEWVRSTFMWSWARLSRLRVVFLIESDDRGTCCLSCSRQSLSWARLHDHGRANKVLRTLILRKA